MICPNCGEPVRTRHLFCVVCGADLKGIRPEKAGERLKRALAKKKSARNEAAAQRIYKKDSDLRALAEDPEKKVFPDFMRNYT